MSLAPVLLFTFKRYEHTKKTLEALEANFLADKTELFVVSDGARNEEEMASVNKVRELILSKNWCAKVTLLSNERNRGLNDNFFDNLLTQEELGLSKRPLTAKTELSAWQWAATFGEAP